jgi:hypothetical protein
MLLLLLTAATLAQFIGTGGEYFDFESFHRHGLLSILSRPRQTHRCARLTRYTHGGLEESQGHQNTLGVAFNIHAQQTMHFARFPNEWLRQRIPGSLLSPAFPHYRFLS